MSNRAAKRIFYRSRSGFFEDLIVHEKHQDIEPTNPSSPASKQVIEALVYGIVNSILSIPALYGYAAIIFRNEAFKEEGAAFAKLVLFSSIVHQVIFSCKSSLPFAIGQVQDAGLIFLSTMATSIALHAETKAAIIPTTLITLSLSTFLLGLVVYLTGKLRLASLISYLPMPVIGGYLAFIGLFCLEAGVSISSGINIQTVKDFELLADLDVLKFAAPALVGGVCLTLVSWNAKSWLTLPSCIVVLPLIFYLYMLIAGISFEEAQSQGWMSLDTGPQRVSDVIKLFDFSQVQWNLMPRQVFTWLSMTFVVAFSSSLDVVAIEMDMKRELDINHELQTVGLSNILSGITGGYTGSYIFSQTIFTYRSKTNSRLVGVVVAISELILFFTPFNIMCYIPKYFFAATLIFIGVELCAEWLLFIYFKVSLKEYLVLLGTFSFIAVTNDLIYGIFLGILLATVNFIVCYSSVTHVETVKKKTSNVIRSYSHQQLLSEHSKKIKVIALHGYLFFGSTVQLLAKVQQLFHGTSSYPTAEDHDKERSIDEAATPLLDPEKMESVVNYSAEVDDGRIQYLIIDFTRVTGMDATAISTGLMKLKQMFSTKDREVHLSFCNLKPRFEDLLSKNSVININEIPERRIRVFNDMNDAFGWAEDELIKSYGEDADSENLMVQIEQDMSQISFDHFSQVTSLPGLHKKLKQLFLSYYQSSTFFFEAAEIMENLCAGFWIKCVGTGELLFDIGDDPTQLVIVLSGELALCVTKDKCPLDDLLSQRSYSEASSIGGPNADTVVSKKRSDTMHSLFDNRNYLEEAGSSYLQPLENEFGAASLEPYMKLLLSNEVALYQRYESGSFVDPSRFLTLETRKHACFSTKPTTFFSLSVTDFKEMKKTSPEAAILLGEMIMKSLALNHKL